MNTNPQFLIGPNLGRPGTAIIPVVVGAGFNIGQSVTLQPDGKIVMAGYSLKASGSDFDFSLIRLNANGSLDTSFNGSGKAIIPVGSSSDYGQSVSIQPDGKIVVAGYSLNGSYDSDFSLIRLNADGSLDTSFNGSGKAIIPVDSSDDEGRSVTLQPDGKIVVAGYSYGGSDSDFSLIRLNADGSLDTSFNDSGTAIIPVGSSDDQGYSVTVQPDGKIVVAGISSNAGSNFDFSLTRLNADGSLDISFNGSGKAIIPVGSGYDEGQSVTVQPDGKIVVAGYSFNGSDNDFSLIRLNADGSLDTSFNGSGKAVIPVGTSTDAGYSVTIQPDGKIVVAGYSYDGTNNDFSLIRLNANGSLDTSFNGSGTAIIPVGSSDDQGYSVTVQPDGKIVVAGISSNPGSNFDFSLIRLNADGSLDTSFNPAASTLGGTVAYVENAPAIALDSAVAIVDAELGALNGGLGNYVGASVTLARQGGADAQDLFSARGNLSFSGGNAVLSGTTIGTVSNALGTLSITFNSSATQAVVNEVLSSIGYANSSDAPPASVQVGWTFNDGNTGGQGAGGALTGIGSTTVNITAVNDAPQFLNGLNLGRPGTAIIPVGGSDDQGQSVIVQPDGKIVVAGYSVNGGDYDFSLIRLNVNGSLDTSFNGSGKAIIPVGSGYDVGRSVVVQPDGKIVVAGCSYDGDYDFSLIRLNANGSLDTSFNGSGTAIIPVGGSDDQGQSVIVQPDGKIVVAGYSLNGGNNDFSLIRLNANGSLDTSFNGSGKAIIPVGSSYDYGQSVTLQPDGKIVVAGFSGNYDFSLIRLNANGSLDTSFNGTGTAIIPVGISLDQGYSVTVQPDGKIVVAGFSGNYDFSLIRLNANGSLDASFNGSGKAIIPVGSSADFGQSVMVQPDGKIVVAGASFNGSDNDFSLIRLNANGSLDTSFNGSGKAIIPVGSSYDYGQSVTLQPDGKIVVAGISSNAGSNFDFSLIRLNADGSLDTSFNPAVSTLDGTVAYVENAPAISLYSTVSIFDAELGTLNGGAGNYAGASVTLARRGGADEQGMFSALGNLSFSGGNAVLSGTTIGTVSNTLGTLSITFNSSATQAVVNEVLSSIGYANSSDAPPASVQVGWTFNDGNTGGQGTGGALTGTGSTTVNITALNDAPTGSVSVSGSALRGQTLTASNTLADADALGAISYQWLANGANIAGATAATHTLAAADLDKTLSVRASYIDGGGTLETVASPGLLVPRFTNTLNENTTLVTTITPGDVMLGSLPKFTLSGDDAALFKISTKGVLTLAVARDFEVPIDDANNDGSYQVSVTLTNAKTGYAVTQDLLVGVTFAAIEGTAGADALKGTKGWDTLDGKAGDDKLIGGDGLDTFIISAGLDKVTDFNARGKTWNGPGAEILQVASGADVSATLKSAWIATSDSFNLGDALVTTSGKNVDLSGITTGDGWHVLNKGKTATLTGSVFDDVLNAGGYADTLYGGNGNDRLISGKGNDTMTGGAGADQFRLNGSKSATADIITDFISGRDRIDLVVEVYKKLVSGPEPGPGPVTADQFVIGTAAQSANQHLIYDSSSGHLMYDSDGAGGIAPILIGVLQPGTELQAADLWVV